MAAVEILSFIEFSKTEDQWTELVEASEYPLPFLSHPWICLWWRHFGKDMEFCAPVVRDGSEFLAGIPLSIRTVGIAGVSLSVAEIAGTGPVPTRGMGLADKANLVVRRNAQEAGKHLTAELGKLLGRVDVINFKGVDDDSMASDTVFSVMDAPHPIRRIARSISPYLPIPRAWEDYLHLRSKNFRKQIKKKKRLIREAGHAEIARMGLDDDCRTWMAEVFSVNERSWSALRGTNLYRHPALKSFFAKLVAAMAEKGWIDLHLLRLDGQAIAYELCFDFEGRLFSYNSSFDKDMAKMSPGTVLTAAVIEAACHRELIEYDLLRGDETYKLRWTDHYRRESEVIILSGSLRSYIYANVGLELKRRLKSWRWVESAADRASGLVARFSYRG